MVSVNSSKTWQKFLEVPIAVGASYGMSPRVIEKLEKEFQAIYIRDIQHVTPEMVMAIGNVAGASLNNLQKSLALMLKAVEKGELEWIFEDTTN